jgi:hypothetical protein
MRSKFLEPAQFIVDQGSHRFLIYILGKNTMTRAMPDTVIPYPGSEGILKSRQPSRAPSDVTLQNAVLS